MGEQQGKASAKARREQAELPAVAPSGVSQGWSWKDPLQEQKPITPRHSLVQNPPLYQVAGGYNHRVITSEGLIAS